MPRGNPDKLIPNSQRTPEQVRENTRKGGIRSGEVRRRKAAQRDAIKELLKLSPEINAKTLKQLKALGMSEDLAVNNDDLLAVALFQMALRGDLDAMKYIDERVGRNPEHELKRAELAARQAHNEQKIEQLKRIKGDDGQSQSPIIIVDDIPITTSE